MRLVAARPPFFAGLDQLDHENVEREELVRLQLWVALPEDAGTPLDVLDKLLAFARPALKPGVGRAAASPILDEYECQARPD